MQPNIMVQFQNSDKNTEIEYPERGNLFIRCWLGSLVVFPKSGKISCHNFEPSKWTQVEKIAATPDNKSQIVNNWYGVYKEFAASSLKQVQTLAIRKTTKFVLTHNNKYLITATEAANSILTQCSVRTKKVLHTWQSDVNMKLDSQFCSYDSKYQLIGYTNGWLGIFDIQNRKTIKNIQILSQTIQSVAFSRNNQSAYICDWSGKIQKITWKPNANSENDFDFTENGTQIGDNFTFSICLTRNEKYLFVGILGFVCVVDTRNMKVRKKLKMSHDLRFITLTQDGKKAILSQDNPGMSILDIETLKVHLIQKNMF